ncbi:hypothetical protein [Tamaricihabitans halophyticus]|uniref:hypothetical protein n=1 Tax=Tamaricihabitans halophyticus TaxID=1262583 RepID=UPI001043F371|nr:hypothetical protein [Tamaricihabitans halophyticus]
MRWKILPISACMAGIGLLALVIGCFLPWSRSGNVLRNSYQSLGLLRHFELFDNGPLDVFLGVWIAIAPVAALCIALFALRLRRTAAGLLVILSILTGTPSAIATVQPTNEEALIGLANSGPVTTVLGSIVAFLGAIGIFLGHRLRRQTMATRKARAGVNR